jgi:hypothetical protein
MGNAVVRAMETSVVAFDAPAPAGAAEPRAADAE